MLARFGTDESRRACPPGLPTPPTTSVPLGGHDANAESAITLRQLTDQYTTHANVYYRKHGRSTREADESRRPW